MKLIYVHNYKEGNSFHQCTTTLTNVMSVEFEDQTNIDNGMWLNIYFNEGEVLLDGKPTTFNYNQTSFEFDPQWDWFTITE